MGTFTYILQNGKEIRKGFSIPWKEGSQVCPQEKENRNLLCLHLQSSQAGAPRDWNLQEIHEHHELFHQRCLREDRQRERPPCSLQQEAHSLLPRSPDLRSPPPPR